MGRARADVAAWLRPFRDGSATGADVFSALTIAAKLGAFWCVGVVLGRRSLQGYKLYR